MCVKTQTSERSAEHVAAGKASTHGAYWAPRMRALLQSWRRLEALTAAHCRFLGRAAEDEDRGAAARALPEGVRCYDVLEQLLTKRRGVATASPTALWNPPQNS